MKKIFVGIVGIIVIFNLFFFTLKNIQIFTSIQQRDSQIVHKFISDNIPQNKKIVGEPMYFYAVKQNNCDFQYMDLYDTLPNREKTHREIYQYDYLIITEHLEWRKPNVVKTYIENCQCELVAELKLPQSSLNYLISTLKVGSVSIISNNERTGYNAKIYKRLK